MLKHYNALLHNHENLDFFYCVSDELDRSYYKDKYQLKRPFFVIFQGNSKFLEMRLNISEQVFEEILLKVPKEYESSLEELSIKSGTDMDLMNDDDFNEKKMIFYDFLNDMLASKKINEEQFSYLENLFLNSLDFLDSITPLLK